MTNNCSRKSLEVEFSLVNIQDRPSSDVKDKWTILIVYDFSKTNILSLDQNLKDHPWLVYVKNIGGSLTCVQVESQEKITEFSI